MDKRLIILLFIFLLISPLECSKKSKKEKKNNHKDKNKEEKENNEEENKNTADDGIYMREETFGQKLKEVLKAMNLKPKRKITKDILKQIFNEIYKKDFEVPNVPEGEISKIEAQKEAERFMDEIFSNTCRGLDYDDKIRVSEIKEWISPKRVQGSLTEVMNRLEQMIGEL